MSIRKHLSLEAKAHDDDYRDKLPFGLPSPSFDRATVWAINDRPYKRGAYRRGWRKRRLFELIGLDRLEGMRVLDVGCGIGQHAVFFAMYGADVHGIDISSEGLRAAKRLAEVNGVEGKCSFEMATVSEMPYEDEGFDLVVYNAVLHHVIKYPNVREETWRVLKPGGRVVFAEGLRDNGLYRLMRRTKHLLSPIKYHGDVDLEQRDLDLLFEDYICVHVERFSLLEKLATVSIGRDYANPLWVRLVYLIAKELDDAILALIPSLRRWCLESVGVATKPGTTES